MRLLPVPLSVTNSLTGSQTVSALKITPTWNTTGVVDAGILENLTNTASGTASLLLDLQVGGVTEFKVDKTGAVNAATSVASATGTFTNITASSSVSSGTNWDITTSVFLAKILLVMNGRIVLVTAGGRYFSMEIERKHA